MHYKTCEICGLKAGRVGDQKRTFMAKFPLDKDRCKRWVQVTGKENLAYVPIKKLHELKYICGKHFRPQDFKTKMTQLKKDAVPSVLITVKPLPDEILMGFPLHIFEDGPGNVTSPQRLLRDHNYYSSSLDKDDADEDRAADIAAADNATPPSPVSAGEPSKAEEGTDDNDAVYTWQSDALVVPCDELTGTIDMDVTELESEPEPEPSAAPTPADEDDNTVHEGLKCNHCHGDIVGFRYTCVQCADYDLCGACEARREHRRHYALRVPAPRPYEEIQTVLLAIRRALSSSIVEVKCDGLPVEVKEESDPFCEVNEPTELLGYENECVEDCYTDMDEHTEIETGQTDTEETHTVIEETHEDIEETHEDVDAVDSDRLEEQVLMDLEEENMNIEYIDLEDDLNIESVEEFQAERNSPLKSRAPHKSIEFISKILPHSSSVKSKQSHPVNLRLTIEKVDDIPKEAVTWAIHDGKFVPVGSKVVRGRSGATVARTNTERTQPARDSGGNMPREARVLVRRLNEEQLSLYENRRTKRGRPYRGWPP